MLNLISVPTIFVCAFLTMATSTLAMAIVRFNSPNETAAGYWSVAFFFGALSAMSFGLMPLLRLYASDLRAFTITSSVVLIWAGFRAFNGKQTKPLLLAAVPMLQLASRFLWPEIRHSPPIDIAFQSSLIGVFSLMAACEAICEKRNRALPMAKPTAAFLLTHGLLHFAHVWFVFFAEQPFIPGRPEPLWWRFFILEAFLHSVVIAISCTLLIKDRSEERHRRASETDALTGVANRRAFVKNAERQLKTANPETVLAIIDLDHFKRINDTHGHLAGDAALIAFATLVAEILPDDTHFGRMGGEEFGILVPGQSSDAGALLENVRQRVEEQRIEYLGVRIPVTISIGAARVETVGNDFDLLVAAADGALYAAKDEGRNRLKFFSPVEALQHIARETTGSNGCTGNGRIGRSSARDKKSVPAL